MFNFLKPKDPEFKNTSSLIEKIRNVRGLVNPRLFVFGAVILFLTGCEESSQDKLNKDRKTLIDWSAKYAKLPIDSLISEAENGMLFKSFEEDIDTSTLVEYIACLTEDKTKEVKQEAIDELEKIKKQVAHTFMSEYVNYSPEQRDSLVNGIFLGESESETDREDSYAFNQVLDPFIQEIDNSDTGEELREVKENMGKVDHLARAVEDALLEYFAQRYPDSLKFTKGMSLDKKLNYLRDLEKGLRGGNYEATGLLNEYQSIANKIDTIQTQIYAAADSLEVMGANIKYGDGGIVKDGDIEVPNEIREAHSRLEIQTREEILNRIKNDPDLLASCVFEKVVENVTNYSYAVTSLINNTDKVKLSDMRKKYLDDLYGEGFNVVREYWDEDQEQSDIKTAKELNVSVDSVDVEVNRLVKDSLEKTHDYTTRLALEKQLEEYQKQMNTVLNKIANLLQKELSKKTE